MNSKNTVGQPPDLSQQKSSDIPPWEVPLTLTSEAELSKLPSQNWLLKHVIPDSGFGVLYGDSGTFKSFVALDLLAAMATGVEKWFGYRVTNLRASMCRLKAKVAFPSVSKRGDLRR
jgi:hypothetical protein